LGAGFGAGTVTARAAALKSACVGAGLRGAAAGTKFGGVPAEDRGASAACGLCRSRS
jgi:hypothetical protein